MQQDSKVQQNSESEKQQEEQSVNGDGLAEDQAITPEAISNMKDKKEEFEKAHNSSYIQYTIYGDAQINTGVVHGNMSQENQSGKKVQSMDDVQELFGMEKTVDEFQMLIVLCILEVVPENHFITLVNELKKCWVQDEEDRKTVSPYISVQNVLNLGAEEVMARFYDESGESEVTCFRLKNSEIASGVKRMIWVDYPVIRNYVVQWMFQIKEMGDFRKLVLSQIGSAFQDLAVLNYNYTKMEIIDALVENDDYYFLTRIMEKLLQTDNYKQNALNLLKCWCGGKDMRQRMMVYSLYQKGRDAGEESVIRKTIEDTMRKELQNGKVIRDEIGSVCDVKFSRKGEINFRVLQENDDTAVIFAQVLAAIFEKCTTPERRVFGFYFCHMFMIDFFYEGYPRYQMLFMKLMQEKEMRSILLPLYRYVWEKKVFREILGEIMRYYLAHLQKVKKDWTYMRWFFRSLSFTGKKSDFENMDKVLKKIENDGNTIAGRIRRELHDLLEQRIAESRRSNG